METNVYFQFNNVEKPYFVLKYFNGENLNRIGFMQLEESQMQNGLPIYDELIVELNRFLEEKNLEKTNISFVLNCKETSKITTVLPDVGDKKMKKLYDLDIANRIPNIDNYDRLSTSNELDNGGVFYDFLVENRYREFFEKLGTELGFTNININYFHDYLYTEITKKIEVENFAYFYEDYGITSLLMVVDGELCAYSSFENTVSNYRLNVAAIIDKHMNSLEKAKDVFVFANKEIECLKPLDVIIGKYSIGA